MKAMLLSLALLSATLTTTSCSKDLIRSAARAFASDSRTIKGSGHLVTKAQDFSATPFTALSLPSTLDAEFIPTAGAMRVEVITSDNVQQYARIEVSKERLVVAWDDHVNIDDEKAVVRIYAPTLEAFDLSGTANCVATAAFTAKDLRIDNTGTGDLKTLALVKARAFSLHNSGTGGCRFHSLQITGGVETRNTGTGENTFELLHATRLHMLNSGTGDDKILNLKTDVVSVTNSGTGDTHLSGEAKEVSLVLSGTGDVDISKLKHASLSAQNSGVGSVIK